MFCIRMFSNFRGFLGGIQHLNLVRLLRCLPFPSVLETKVVESTMSAPTTVRSSPPASVPAIQASVAPVAAASVPPTSDPASNQQLAVQIMKIIKKDRLSNLFTTALLGGCIIALVYRLKIVEERLNSVRASLRGSRPDDSENRFRPVVRRPPPQAQDDYESEDDESDDDDDDVVVEVEHPSHPPPAPPAPPAAPKPNPETETTPGAEGNTPSEEEEDDEEEAPPSVKSVQFVDKKRNTRRAPAK